MDMIHQNPNDPCYGKKNPHNFNYDQGSRTTPDDDGAKTAREHITNRHVTQIPRWQNKKSWYLFAAGIASTKDDALRLKKKWDVVEDYNATTFASATGIKSGSYIVYIAAFPVYYNEKGSIGTWVGADKGNNLNYTNVNTLFLKTDCVTVVTSHPGLPAGVPADNPNIGRVWQASGPVWRIP